MLVRVFQMNGNKNTSLLFNATDTVLSVRPIYLSHFELKRCWIPLMNQLIDAHQLID